MLVAENSVVVDAPMVEEVKREFVKQRRLLHVDRRDRRGRAGAGHARSGCRTRRSSGARPPSSPQQAGITVPPETRVLIAELDGVGRDYPLSIEKLCPVLSFYVVKDWREGCERCKQILRYGGMGHTMSIHSRNDEIILEFGLRSPPFRIVVNTPTTHGSIGSDDRARSGDDAGLRRVRRQHHVRQHLAAASAEHQAARLRDDAGRRSRKAAGAGPLDRGPQSAEGTSRRRARRHRGRAAGQADRRVPGVTGISAPAPDRLPCHAGSCGGCRRAMAPRLAARDLPRTSSSPKPVDFVCEDDVRQAMKQGRKIVIGERSIVTPAARDLGEEHHVFTQAAWPR